MFEVEKAVVTGAGGLIGSSLVEHLVSGGADVVAIDKMPLQVPGARVVQVDLCGGGGISEWLTPETTVYHLAASANVAASVTDPRHDFNNTLGVLFEILESARETGADARQVSTRRPAISRARALQRSGSPGSSSTIQCRGRSASG